MRAAGAFALVAADGMRINGSQSYAFGFQRIDFEKRAFLPDVFSVQFSGMGTIEGDEFKKPETLETSIRFGGKPVPPGEYVLIVRTDFAAYGYFNSTTANCFSQGAPVFRIRAGYINLITAGHVQGDSSIAPMALEPQAKEALAGYPNMLAPVAFAEPVGSVTFETGKKTFREGEICKGTAVVSFSARAT